MSAERPMVTVDAVLRLASGATVPLAVSLHNPTTEPCDFRLTLIGLDAAWTAGTLTWGPVQPGDDTVAQIDVTAPAGTPAGRFPFVVSAQPVHTVTGDPLGDAVYADATAVVGDASRVLVAVEPAEPSGVSGGRFFIALDNRSNEAVQLSLSMKSTRGLYLRLRRTNVTVPPGQVERVRARANVHRRWIGPRRRMPFVVTAQGQTTPVSTDAVFVARPLLSSGLTRVLAVLAVVALWASIGAIALGKVSQHARGKSNSQLTVGVGTQGGASGGGAGAGGGGGGAGAKSTTTLSSNGRINGTVTGADPSGVRITLKPTSLVDESAEGATFTAAQSSGAVGKLANVAYEKPARARRTLTTFTQKDGSWAFAGVTDPGYYLLTFSKAGYQTVRQIITKDATAAKPLSVQLVAGRGKLSGSVTGPDGPVPGATVTITDGTVTITTSTPTTGKIGTWSVSGLSTPANYLVTASGTGLAAASRLVPVDAGKSVDRIDLTVQRGVESLVGHVTQIDDTGATDDAGGVTVTATDGKNVHTATSLTVASTTTDGTSSPGLIGSFTLPNLPVGGYDVTFSKDGFASRTQHVTLDGKASSLSVGAQLTSAGSVVTGTVLDSAGHGIATAGIVLTSDTATYKSTTDTNGVFRLSGVAPGTYVLSAEKFGKVTGFASVEAAAGKVPPPVTLTLPDVPGGLLPTTGHIRGRLVDARTGGLITCGPSVKPADCGITVTTVDHRADGDHKFSLFAQPDTEYVVPPADQKNGQGLQSGLHHVTFSAPGYETASINVQVPVGGFAEAPQVALFPDAGISGTITPGVASALPAGTCVIAVPYDGQTKPATPPCTPPASGATCPAPTGGSCAIVDTSTGDYTVSGIPHGSYLVFVIPSDPEWIPVSAQPITVALGETKRYDATLNRLGRIHLVVRVPAPNSVAIPKFPVTVTLSGPQTATDTIATGGAGEDTLTGLRNGTNYQITVNGNDGSDSYTGTLSNISVSTNQTADVSVVIVKNPTAAVGRLVYTVDSQVFGVAGATVVVTGVTGYSGTTPVPTQITVVTDSQGCFALTPTGQKPVFTTTPDNQCTFPDTLGSTPPRFVEAASFLEPTVQYEIDASNQGFAKGLRVNGTASGHVTAIELQPPPARTFADQLWIDGKAPTGVDMSKATVSVTAAAPGSSNVVITAASDGTLTWHDSNYTDPNKVRPGTYQVRVSLPGYDDGTAELDCPFALNAPACTFTSKLSLGSHVGLTVNVLGPSATKVNGAVVTLSGDKLSPITVTAAPGSNSVTFPDLSAGDNKINYNLEVHAAGYATKNVTGLKFTAGSGTHSTDVVLDRLGTITGRVLGSSAGQTFPLAGVPVVATSGSQHFSGSSAADGTYSITGTTDTDGLDLTKVWTVSATLAGFNGGAGKTADLGDVDFSTDPNPATRDITLPADPVAVTVNVHDDSAGSPLVTNATVTMTPLSASGTTYTGDDSATAGHYLMCHAGTCVIPPTAYALQVTAPNHAPLSTTVSVQLGVASQTIAITMASRLNAITVHALGQTGATPPTDLSGASVVINQVDPVSLSVIKTVTPATPPTTNSNGDYQLSNLDDGTYQVTVSDAGYADATRTVTLAAGQLAAIDATLQRQLGQVNVNVQSGGSNLSGALVSLVARGNGAVSQSAQQSDGSGNTTFSNVIPGDYVVTTTGPGAHLPGRSADFSVASSTVNETVSIDETALAVTITPCTAAPPHCSTPVSVPTATVTLTPSGSSGAILNDSVVADGSGHTIFVPSGVAFTVSAVAAGYDTASVAVASGATSANLTLVQSDTGAIDASVTLDGHPAKNAQVTIEGLNQVFTTGPNGADVVVGGLSPGNYDVSATLTDGQTSTQHNVGVSSGATATPTFAFTSPSAAPTGSLQVNVVDSSGLHGVSGATVNVSGSTAGYTTNGSGTITINGLAPSTYTVFMTPPSSSTMQIKPVVVTAGITTAITFTVPDNPASVNVQLALPLHVSGNIGGATVTISNTSASATAVTDNTGLAQFSGLPVSASYTITATTTDGGTASTTAALSAGSNGTKSLTLAYTGTLVVHCQDTSASPPSPRGSLAVTLSTGQSTTTDGSGNAVFTGLAPGTYTASASSHSATGDVIGNDTVTVVIGF